MSSEPAYLRPLRNGELRDRARLARERLEERRVCPRQCGANRLRGAQNAGCRTGESVTVCGCHRPCGEESPLVGCGGSGTIVFS